MELSPTSLSTEATAEKSVASQFVQHLHEEQISSLTKKRQSLTTKNYLDRSLSSLKRVDSTFSPHPNNFASSSNAATIYATPRQHAKSFVVVKEKEKQKFFELLRTQFSKFDFDFDTILRLPPCRRLFRSYLDKIHTLEQFDFLEAVETYKAQLQNWWLTKGGYITTSTDKQSLLHQFDRLAKEKILDLFLQKGTDKELNIGSEVKQEVLSDFESIKQQYQQYLDEKVAKLIHAEEEENFRTAKTPKSPTGQSPSADDFIKHQHMVQSDAPNFNAVEEEASSPTLTCFDASRRKSYSIMSQQPSSSSASHVRKSRTFTSLFASTSESEASPRDAYAYRKSHRLSMNLAQLLQGQSSSLMKNVDLHAPIYAQMSHLFSKLETIILFQLKLDTFPSFVKTPIWKEFLLHDLPFDSVLQVAYVPSEFTDQYCQTEGKVLVKEGKSNSKDGNSFKKVLPSILNQVSKQNHLVLLSKDEMLCNEITNRDFHFVKYINISNYSSMWDLIHSEKSTSSDANLAVYEAKLNFVVGQRAELGKYLYNMHMTKSVMYLPFNYELITKYLSQAKNIMTLDTNIKSFRVLENLKIVDEKKTRKVSSVVHHLEYQFPKTLMSLREFVTISTLKKEKTSNMEDCYIFYLKSFDRTMADAVLESHDLHRKKVELGTLQLGIIVTKVFEQQSRVCIFANVNMGGKYTKNFQPILRNYLPKYSTHFFAQLLKALSQPNLIQQFEQEQQNSLGFWEACKENM